MRKLPPLKSWKKRTKVLVVVTVLLVLLAAYPCLVLGYVWIKVYQSDLPGGRNGPLDAYRHTLASALVSYTLNEGVVEWVSEVMESEGIPTQRMDRHNNRIGAKIGSTVSSLCEIEPMVAKKVSEGRMMTADADQITWMPKSIWWEAKMW